MGKIADWLFPELTAQFTAEKQRADHYAQRLSAAEQTIIDQARKIREFESQVQPVAPKIVRAKTGAQVRQIVEQQNEREFEESVKNGI